MTTPESPNERSMVRIVEVTREELLQQKQELLQRIRLTRDQLADRAENCHLAGDEWAAWDELRNIEYLLGGE